MPQKQGRVKKKKKIKKEELGDSKEGFGEEGENKVGTQGKEKRAFPP